MKRCLITLLLGLCFSMYTAVDYAHEQERTHQKRKAHILGDDTTKYFWITKPCPAANATLDPILRSIYIQDIQQQWSGLYIAPVE